MVKPAIYTIDPADQKAKEKALEAGQLDEIPIKVDGNVVIEAGVSTGYCTRSRKIAIGLVSILLVIGAVIAITMVISNCSRVHKDREWEGNRHEFGGPDNGDGQGRHDHEGGHAGSHPPHQQGQGEHHGPHHGGSDGDSSEEHNWQQDDPRPEQ